MQERQSERQSAIATLETQLAELSDEKAALERRNSVLEQAMRIKKEQEDYSTKPASWDPELFVDVSFVGPEDMLPLITIHGDQRRLSKEDLAKLSFREHAALYTVGQIQPASSRDVNPPELQAF